MDPTEYKNLPFGVEYARSNRSTCKGCKYPIGQDSLRMSVREPSRFFDGLQDNWFHFACFWKRIKPGKVEINERSIRGMDVIKWDDQEEIRAKITAFMSGALGASADEMTFSAVKVEYAKSNRGKCAECKKAIAKDEIKFGKMSSWYHQNCLFKEAKYSGKIEDIDGLNNLSDEDKLTVFESLKDFSLKEEIKDEVEENGKGKSKKRTAIKADVKQEEEETATKKPRGARSRELSNKELLKKQSDLMWELRKGLEENLHKTDMHELLTSNGLSIPSGGSHMIDSLVDAATFGCCKPCPKCGGELRFSTSRRTYVCTGQLSEYTKCTYVNENPDRVKFTISKEMKEIPYLKKLKVNLLPKRVYNEELAKEAVVGHSDAFKHLGARCMKSLEKGEVEGKSMGVGSGLSRQLVKGGTVVDQECEYSDVSHVHRAGNGVLYSVVLGTVDLVTNKNSYYKIQLLKHDTKPTFYLFRSWGRVGTVIGGNRTEVFHNKDKAVSAFEQLFLEKSGNNWKKKDNFKKLPGYMDMVETDFSELEQAGAPAVAPGSKSTLPEAVKDVLLMIFDMERLKSTMQDFQLDLDKMPLGKLSKKQITNAFSVLTELQAILAEKADSDKILDATNRFYTMIPHNFGSNKPQLLNSTKIIKEKCDMLSSLLEIKIAYDVIKQDQDEPSARDPLDVHYEHLKCNMEVVDRYSEEFKRIDLYMKNTHGETHTTFQLEIVDILRISRQGEEDKFKADIGNRRLLWHGSGTANYVGILSQGLRIAPPEAPVSGYMFGKGVYFADMASKSANYCRVYSDNTDGLLLLCDVALGKVKQEVQAKDHTLKSIKGYNSVQGVGQMEPNPKKTIECEDGYSICLDKPVKSKKSNLQLLYNEYIVYDVDQIRMRYLIRTRFKMPNMLM
ncbi:hypothetical protein Q1695_001866 [Nippostrongylus brasiliensis]|nr:hypothetical protein Q1695_001866 [Nippostrongylus brasiliensis]